MTGFPQRGDNTTAEATPTNRVPRPAPARPAPWSDRLRPSRLKRGRRGFTLLELMLVLALMAVAGTMFLVSLESLGRSSPMDEFESAFWRATTAARERALATRRVVELRWDEDSLAFVLNGGGEPLQVAIETKEKAEKFGATFTEEVAANDFILVRGELVTRRATPAVRFFPDGSCQAFVVEFAWGESRHRVTIDPWTGAAMLADTPAGKGGRS